MEENDVLNELNVQPEIGNLEDYEPVNVDDPDINWLQNKLKEGKEESTEGLIEPPAPVDPKEGEAPTDGPPLPELNRETGTPPPRTPLKNQVSEASKDLQTAQEGAAAVIQEGRRDTQLLPTRENEPLFDTLRLDIPLSEKELHGAKLYAHQYAKEHPEIYDRNGDGVVDLRDDPLNTWLQRRAALLPADKREFDDHLHMLGRSSSWGALTMLRSAFSAYTESKDAASGEMYVVDEQAYRTSTGPTTGKDVGPGGEILDEKYIPNNWDPLGLNDLKAPTYYSWYQPFVDEITHYLLPYVLLRGAGAKAGVTQQLGLKPAVSTGKWQGLAHYLKNIAAPNVGREIGTSLLYETPVSIISERSRRRHTLANLPHDWLSKTDHKGVSGFVKRVPWLEEAFRAIAVQDDDNPLLIQAKNIFEEIGIMSQLEGLWGFLGGAKGFAKHKLKLDNVTEQIVEKGAKELDDAIPYERPLTSENRQKTAAAGDAIGEISPEESVPSIADTENLPPSKFRGHKNQPFADPGQGAPNSTGSAENIRRQLNRIDESLGQKGSTDSVMTPTQAERMADISGMEPGLLKEKARELLGDIRFQQMLNDAKRTRKSFRQLFEPAYKRMQEVMGRDAAGMTADEFWNPIESRLKERFVTDNVGYETWAMENVLAADLVNAALFKQLRDVATATKELKDITDIFAVDGPMKTIADRLVVGLTNVKRSRYLISTDFSKLKGPKAATTAIAERTAELHDETVDGVRLMMQFLKESDSPALADGILEVFSMSNKIQSWQDFDKWMRAKLRGGEFAGKTDSGALLRELQGVMVNSILSGPKTPLRALMGTAANSYLNSVNTVIGGAARAPFIGDTRSVRAATHNLVGMFELIPDAWKIFRSNMDANFSGDIATIKTRFSERSRFENNFELFGEWAERSGNDYDKMAFRIANTAYKLNNNRLATWGPRTLASIDQTFEWLMANARSKELGYREVMQKMDDGIFQDWTPQLLKEAQDKHYARLLDEDGNIDITKDLFLEQQFREVTLTSELKGFSKKLEGIMSSTPWAKPFFLFARTGINGIGLSIKNAPIIGALVKDSTEILSATAKDIDSGNLLKHGIENVADLQQAKNLIIGRQIVGNAVTMMAGMAYLNGRLTGNGPQDRQLRETWRQSGAWQPRSLRVGNVWVSYDSLEPFNVLLAAIADAGDNQALMGPQWSQDKLTTISFAIGQGIVNKSYMQGLTQLVDLLSLDPSTSNGKIIGNMMNNSLPLGGARLAMGQFLNPVMKEVNNSIVESIRNRNLYAEILPGDDLPVKYDMLNGEPLRDWNFMERMWNTLSPVQLKIASGPGRTLLWNSNYDLRLSIYSAPNNGPDLSDSPAVRSEFMRLIGKQNIENQLNALASRPEVIASVRQMKHDLKNGNDHLDPMKAYAHNKLIKNIFERARKKAWAQLVQTGNPDVLRLINEQKEEVMQTRTRRNQTSGITFYNKTAPTEEILNLPVK